jgi:hypothetical protein
MSGEAAPKCAELMVCKPQIGRSRALVDKRAEPQLTAHWPGRAGSRDAQWDTFYIWTAAIGIDAPCRHPAPEPQISCRHVLARGVTRQSAALRHGGQRGVLGFYRRGAAPRLLRGVFDGFYRKIHAETVVFNTNRLWCSRMPALTGSADCGGLRDAGHGAGAHDAPHLRVPQHPLFQARLRQCQL